MNPHSRYIVAGARPWNRTLFDERLARLPGEWDFAADAEALAAHVARDRAPRYIFFLHWSKRVPGECLQRHECVGFHMADVPYGRGGSPLQNLIQRGHRDTRLSALRMTAELDAGPVYAKLPLSLEGSAEEIYVRAGHLSADIIERMVRDEPAPTPQQGDPVIFRRRTPAQSAISSDLGDVGALYDFIRMLDAEGYPRAFLQQGGFRLELSRARLCDGRLTADVAITHAP